MFPEESRATSVTTALGALPANEVLNAVSLPPAVAAEAVGEFIV